MDPFEASAAKFIRFFAKAVRSVRMYNVDHPSVKQDLDQAFATINEMLGPNPEVSLGVQEGVLMLQNRPSKALTSAGSALIQLLKGKRIATLAFPRGFPREEFSALVNLMSRKDDDVLKDNRIDPALLAPFRSIKLRELVFLLVDSGQEVSATAASAAHSAPAPSGPPPPPQAPEDSLTLLDRHFQSALQSLSPDGDAAPEKSESSLASFMTSFSNSARQAGSTPSAPLTLGYLERLLTKGWPGIGSEEFQGMFERVLGGLSPETRETFNGGAPGSAAEDALALTRRLPVEFRASLVAADLRAGSRGAGKLRETIESLAPSPSERLELMDALSKAVLRSGGSVEQSREMLGKVMNLLPAVEEVRREGGSILVIEPDSALAAAHDESLREAGYAVTVTGDGRKARETLREKKGFDAIVMEMRLPGIGGLELLPLLQSEHGTPPVVVVTQSPGLREEYEVATYPKLRFFKKPAVAAEILEALRELIPPKPAATPGSGAPAAEAEKVSEADLRKAKSVQMSLFPKSMPGADGYVLAAANRLAEETLSDFYDVGYRGTDEIFVVLCGVSGPAPAGARILMMLRNIFRTVAETGASPLIAVLEANDLISRQLQPGVFVNAVYAVLNLKTGTVEVANVGHEPPITWSKEMALAASGMPPAAATLGAMSRPALEPRITQEKIALAPGDFVVFVTDGLPEAKHPKLGKFALKGLIKTINRQCGLPPAELANSLLDAVTSHLGGAALADDLSVVILRREG
ncbi:MAG: fused response regulator/phosphatase [Planctomycetes bacterium]|nr:fused response regulator/phosphatase [Planctomycetota bacterium]